MQGGAGSGGVPGKRGRSGKISGAIEWLVEPKGS